MMDFVADQLSTGHKFLIWTVVNVLTREALAVAPRHRIRAAEDVVAVVNRLV
jgi:hypothetical protein